MLITSTIESIFSPTSDMAALTSKIFPEIGKTNRTDVRIPGEVNIALETNHGNIIEKISGIKFFVDENISCIIFDMGVEFGIIVNVPFSKTNPLERFDNYSRNLYAIRILFWVTFENNLPF